MKHVKFGTAVTPAAWQARMSSGPLSLHGWRKSADDGIFIDLTKVEFADFVSLGDILLLLDRAVRDGVSCSLSLPFAEATPGEREHDSALRLEAKLRRRANARTFMEHSGFVNALRADHWPDGAFRLVERSPDEDVQSEGDSIDAASQGRTGRYKLARIFPLTWLSPMSGGQLRQSESFLSFVLGRLQEQIGLNSEDARSIAHAVLTELVENVAEHAGGVGVSPPRALVGAMRIDGASYARRRDDQVAQVRDFAAHVESQESDVLRIFVGDAGVGLLDRLKPVMERRGISSTVVDRELPRPLTNEEDAAFFAFDRWSTSGPSPRGYDRGTRGLNRIERLVRSYGGFITVRSGRAHAGHIMLEQGAGIRSVLGGTYRSPGTRLEIAIVPQASPMLAKLATTSPPGETALALNVLEMNIDVELGISDAQREAVDDAAQAAARDDQDAGLVVVARTRAGSRSLPNPHLLDLVRLIALSSTAQALVALVLPDADQHSLRLALQDLQDEVDGSNKPHWGSPFEPSLAIDGRGRASWFGTTRPILAILDDLSSAPGERSFEELEASYVAGSGKLPATLRLFLRDAHSLVAENNGQLRLHIPPAAVIGAVQKQVRNALRDTIAHSSGSKGVHHGAFLSPTLRRSDIWIDVERLIRQTVGAELVTFAMARMLEHRMGSLASPDWIVARAAGAPTFLVQEVSDHLGVEVPIVELPSELDVGAEDPGRIFAGQTPVILVTDLLATENTVRRSLAHVVGLGGNPIAVLGVLDARRHTQRPINILGRSVPVFTLSTIKFRLPPGDAEIVPIDPVLRRPIAASMTEAPESELLLDWCERVPQSLALGHLIGASGGHFTVYPLIDRLLGNEKVAEDVVSRILLAATLNDSPVAILYPRSAPPYSRILAEQVASELRRRSRQPVTIEGVNRVRAGGRWTFPSEIRPFPDGRQALVLDWGAMTASTIHQLIRLAADAGATSISAVVLISELDDNDDAALRQIAQIRGRRIDDHQAEILDLWPRQMDVYETTVDVKVEFVTATALHGFTAIDCPTCSSRSQYLQLARSSSSDFIRHHAEKIAADLAPLPRTHMSMVGTDQSGEMVPVSQAADYLRWRRLLERSMRSTLQRQRLLGQLRIANGEPPYSRSALLRLLAAEPHWLKLPPLSFEECRQILVEICWEACRRYSTEAASDSVRRFSLAVLAQCRPETFVQRAPHLFAALHTQRDLVAELFAQLERLVRRPSFDTPVEHRELRRAIDDLIEETNHLPRDEDSRAYFLALSAIALHLTPDIRPPEGDVQSAWAFMRRTWLKRVVSHSLESPWIHIQAELDNLAESPPEFATLGHEAVMQSLREAISVLEELALNMGEAVKLVLLSEHYRNRLGSENSARVAKALDGEWRIEFAGLMQQIDDLYQTKQSANGSMWFENYSRVVATIEWWRQHFVNARLDDQARAVLPQFLDEMPCRPLDVFESVFEDSDFELQSHLQRDTEVFLPSDLLKDAFRHIRLNAERRHWDGVGHVKFLVTARLRGDAVEISVANTATTQSGTVGAGLSAFDAKLGPFGGRLLRSEHSNTGRWTYSVTVAAQRWRGDT